MFSKAFGYALRGLVYVAIHGREGHRVGLQEISDGIKVPHHFLGKIMQDLVRHQIIDSAKGPNGGFFVNERTLDTTLIAVLTIVDGSAVFNQCALGIRNCNAVHPCPLHEEFAAARNQMLGTMSVKTIGKMADEVENGSHYLSR